MGKSISGQGSELHRLQPMRDDYDQELFNKLYRVCKPVIRRLSKQIDYKRFNLTEDIIYSYFWDKMLFVFNRYYGTCSEEHLKAKILASLATFKNKLLRSAYSEQAQYNQQLAKLEDLYDDSKELVDDSELEVNKAQLLDKLYAYMKDHLSPDAYLVFEAVITPPPYIQERIKASGHVTHVLLVEFFDLPRTKSSVKYISELRSDIQYWESRASDDIKFD